MSKTRGFLFAAALTITGNLGSAATITYPAGGGAYTIPQQAVSFSNSVNVQAFDPSLGTLTGVSITVSANFSVLVGVINLNTAGHGYTSANGTGNVTISGPGSLGTTP